MLRNISLDPEEVGAVGKKITIGDVTVKVRGFGR